MQEGSKPVPFDWVCINSVSVINVLKARFVTLSLYIRKKLDQCVVATVALPSTFESQGSRIF